MISEKILPFPRGTTYSQCNSGGTQGLVTMADATAHELEGRTYQVRDTIHKTGLWITLRIVKNDQTTSLQKLSRKLVGFTSSSAGDFGRRCGPFAATAGQLAKPIDDAYYYGTEGTNQSSVQNSCTALDLYYVVDEGPCRVETTSGVAAIAAGDPAAVDTEDGMAREAADSNYPFGIAMEAGDTAAMTATLYYVSSGLHGWEHA